MHSADEGTGGTEDAVPTEIEAKIKIDDFAAVRTRLTEQGAQRLKLVLETNTFLDRPKGLLRTSDRGLRVRRMQNLDTGADESVMTYKGPRQPGELKSREELEITVDNPDTAILLLERLGFTRSLTFEKRRESWSIANCQVELDELPHLGKFVEIEGPDEESVQQVRRQLSLQNEPVEQSGYASLLHNYLTEKGVKGRAVRF